jgi:CubicO group peptidase (beta-lactamase class C family)
MNRGYCVVLVAAIAAMPTFSSVAEAGGPGAGFLSQGTTAAPDASSSPLALGPGPLIPRPDPSLVKAHLPAKTLNEAIDLCVEANMAVQDTPGASVAVILNGELLYEAGYGVKHRNMGGDVDPETIFRIGSVTKQLTAAGVMQQREAGRLMLDDPVTRHIPEFEVPGRWSVDTMTVQHLLTHTSGIPDLPFELDDRVDDDALSDWAADHGAQSLHTPPGVLWNYSNPNFNLAGLVAERASGIPYREYMHTRVFAPAGMTRTTFDPAEVMADGNFSYGHYRPSGVILETIYAPEHYDSAITAPAGFAFSTAGDLVSWALTLIDGGGAVLEPESTTEMQQPVASQELLPNMAYGYGIFIEPFGDLTIRQHGGNIPGWGTFLIWEDTHRFAVAVLANTFQSLSDAAYCIADAVLQPGTGPPVNLPFDPSILDGYAGGWDFTNSLGQQLLGGITRSGNYSLTVQLLDPVTNQQDSFDLEYYQGEIFLADLNGDGLFDSVFDFLGRGNPSRTHWLRNRTIVATPQHTPRQGFGSTAP